MKKDALVTASARKTTIARSFHCVASGHSYWKASPPIEAWKLAIAATHSTYQR